MQREKKRNERYIDKEKMKYVKQTNKQERTDWIRGIDNDAVVGVVAFLGHELGGIVDDLCVCVCVRVYV